MADVDADRGGRDLEKRVEGQSRSRWKGEEEGTHNLRRIRKARRDEAKVPQMRTPETFTGSRSEEGNIRR